MEKDNYYIYRVNCFIENLKQIFEADLSYLFNINKKTITDIVSKLKKEKNSIITDLETVDKLNVSKDLNTSIHETLRRYSIVEKKLKSFYYNNDIGFGKFSIPDRNSIIVGNFYIDFEKDFNIIESNEEIQIIILNIREFININMYLCQMFLVRKSINLSYTNVSNFVDLLDFMRLNQIRLDFIAWDLKTKFFFSEYKNIKNYYTIIKTINSFISSNKTYYDKIIKKTINSNERRSIFRWYSNISSQLKSIKEEGISENYINYIDELGLLIHTLYYGI